MKNHRALYLSAMSLAMGMLSACGGSDEPEGTVGTALSVTATPEQIAAARARMADPGYMNLFSPGPAVPQCGITNFDAEMLAAVNAARAVARTCGTEAKPAVHPLVSNAQLGAAAVRHNTDMTTKLFLDHTGSDESTMSTRVDGTGYQWSKLGENIAHKQKSIPDVIDSWLKSPGHCANMMRADVTQFGAACSNTASDGSWYWTQVYGAPL